MSHQALTSGYILTGTYFALSKSVTVPNTLYKVSDDSWNRTRTILALEVSPILSHLSPLISQNSKNSVSIVKTTDLSEGAEPVSGETYTSGVL
jgi:hypothetical protein